MEDLVDGAVRSEVVILVVSLESKCVLSKGEGSVTETGLHEEPPWSSLENSKSEDVALPMLKESGGSIGLGVMFMKGI